MIKELVEKTRTVRRFQQGRATDAFLLRKLVDLARLGGSAGNAQSLKCMINIPDSAIIFPTTDTRPLC